MARSRPCTRTSSDGPSLALEMAGGLSTTAEACAFSQLRRSTQRLHVQIVVPATVRRTSRSAPVTESIQLEHRPRSPSQANRSHIALSMSIVPSWRHSASVVPPRRMATYLSLSRLQSMTPPGFVSGRTAEPPVAAETTATAAARATARGAWWVHRMTPPDRPPLRLASSTSSSQPVPGDEEPKAAKKAARAPMSLNAPGAGASPLPASAASHAVSGAGPSGGKATRALSATASSSFEAAAAEDELPAAPDATASVEARPSSRERHVTHATRCFSWAARGAAT
mmetsp:Transcript_78835/g.219160  ORF Transcript_78835/g.219160 Transcript_78835/m.219160 type:complete len:283 (-) Transcript_78835:288-1136(-)